MKSVFMLCLLVAVALFRNVYANTGEAVRFMSSMLDSLFGFNSKISDSSQLSQKDFYVRKENISEYNDDVEFALYYAEIVKKQCFQIINITERSIISGGYLKKGDHVVSVDGDRTSTILLAVRRGDTLLFAFRASTHDNKDFPKLDSYSVGPSTVLVDIATYGEYRHIQDLVISAIAGDAIKGPFSEKPARIIFTGLSDGGGIAQVAAADAPHHAKFDYENVFVITKNNHVPPFKRGTLKGQTHKGGLPIVKKGIHFSHCPASRKREYLGHEYWMAGKKAYRVLDGLEFARWKLGFTSVITADKFCSWFLKTGPDEEDAPGNDEL